MHAEQKKRQVSLTYRQAEVWKPKCENGSTAVRRKTCHSLAPNDQLTVCVPLIVLLDSYNTKYKVQQTCAN